LDIRLFPSAQLRVHASYPHGSSVYKFEYEKKKIIDLTNIDLPPPRTSQYYFQQLISEQVLWQKLDRLKEIHRNNGKEAKEESTSKEEGISKEL